MWQQFYLVTPTNQAPTQLCHNQKWGYYTTGVIDYNYCMYEYNYKYGYLENECNWI